MIVPVVQIAHCTLGIVMDETLLTALRAWCRLALTPDFDIDAGWLMTYRLTRDYLGGFQAKNLVRFGC